MKHVSDRMAFRSCMGEESVYADVLKELKVRLKNVKKQIEKGT